MPEFLELNAAQLIEKRLQLHNELGELLLVQAGLKASLPKFNETGSAAYFDRMIEVDEAINLCVSSIPKVRAHLKYRDVDVSALEREMYAAPIRPTLSSEDQAETQVEDVLVELVGDPGVVESFVELDQQLTAVQSPMEMAA